MKKINHSDRDREQDNQQERLVNLDLSDDYFIGIVEGEGCFYIEIVKSPETKSGWQVIYFFKVSQNPSGRMVLESLKKRLDCGYIKQNNRTDTTDKSLAYVVRDLPSLVDKVIPFFATKLITQKAQDYDKFVKVLEIVSLNQHLTKEGMRKILDLAYSMNTTKRKVTKTQILSNFN